MLNINFARRIKMQERFLYKTDPKEMDRRWQATLDAMKKDGVDCLFLTGFDKWCSGVSKYLTDVIWTNYPNYFLFSEKGISAFGHSGWGNPGIPPFVANRNFCENIGIPGLPTTNYGYEWYAREILKVIKNHGYKKNRHTFLLLYSGVCLQIYYGKYAQKWKSWISPTRWTT